MTRYRSLRTLSLRPRTWIAPVLATWLLSAPAAAAPRVEESVQSAEPSAPSSEHAAAETLGFSPEALERLDARLQRYVDEGELVGGVLLVQRYGQPAYHRAFGRRDREQGAVMQRDAIFRIASQTKAIVSVAAMVLQEEGKLLISHPVGRYLPEYAETTVAVVNGEDGEAAYETVPATRPITIRDLLTHTAGVSYGNGPAAAEWSGAGITGWYFADRDEPIRETVRRIAALPFNAQPGAEFVYGYSTDILGAVVEVASGQPLDALLRDRILDPLGMRDTHFYLPPDERGRLATVYSLTSDGLQRAPDEGTMVSQGHYVDGPRRSFSGGAGLLSTARDYARFQQMLLQGGELDGVRVLSPSSVELMTVNHVGELFVWGAGTGFGLGFSVLLDLGARGTPGSVGEYAWGGAYHSAYWNDPEEQLTVTYMTQLIPAGTVDDHQVIRALIYAALRSDSTGAASP
ncbi:MAG: class A beta-lactamase-related serine hydrolase [Acidobacteria bacterium]|mgnify:CR=1 FL=1|nr:MAG: class A beta-lactamase-related serine hydrolase [Acidobacteriota bacterium]REK11521.1 MAG: class A beta-lactamase-related serine hydrolase [Acidobacteriota bacterium]